MGGQTGDKVGVSVKSPKVSVEWSTQQCSIITFQLGVGMKIE